MLMIFISYVREFFMFEKLQLAHSVWACATLLLSHLSALSCQPSQIKCQSVHSGIKMKIETQLFKPDHIDGKSYVIPSDPRGGLEIKY